MLSLEAVEHLRELVREGQRRPLSTASEAVESLENRSEGVLPSEEVRPLLQVKPCDSSQLNSPLAIDFGSNELGVGATLLCAWCESCRELTARVIACLAKG